MAALRASQLGIKNICVVEKDRPGGVCLNWGCIPSKSLIHSAETFDSRKDLEKMGVKIDITGFNFGSVYKQSRKVTDILSRGVAFLLKKNNITLIQKEFKFVSDYELESEDGEKITAEKIIIASGAVPRSIPNVDIDEDLIISSKGALSLTTLPSKVLIVGSGAIGVEFAFIWNSFGVEVHIVEIMENILPMEDEESALLIRNLFEKKGIKIFTKASIDKIEKNGNKSSVSITANDGTKIMEEYEKILIATGRKASTEALGIENTSIQLEKGFIKVNERFMTNVAGIYAIGDVINTLQLAHVGSREGELAAEYISGKKDIHAIDYNFVPKCIYCQPEVASFGFTEKQLKANNVSYRKVNFPYRINGKSVSSESTNGFVKVLYEENKKNILGAHVAGHNATEIIHELLLIKEANIAPQKAGNIIHAHPTLSEMIMESMKMIEGCAVNV